VHADRAAQATPFWLRVYISLTILAAYWVSPPFTQLDGHGEALLIWGATLLGELFGHSWEASDREHFLERMWDGHHEGGRTRQRHVHDLHGVVGVDRGAGHIYEPVRVRTYTYRVCAYCVAWGRYISVAWGRSWRFQRVT
jgi:hypothetical protein